jgi:hypothetical protein
MYTGTSEMIFVGDLVTIRKHIRYHTNDKPVGIVIEVYHRTQEELERWEWSARIVCRVRWTSPTDFSAVVDANELRRIQSLC